MAGSRRPASHFSTSAMTGVYNITAGTGVLGLEIRPIPSDDLGAMVEEISDLCRELDIELDLEVMEAGVACPPDNPHLVRLDRERRDDLGTTARSSARRNPVRRPDSPPAATPSSGVRPGSVRTPTRSATSSRPSSPTSRSSTSLRGAARPSDAGRQPRRRKDAKTSHTEGIAGDGQGAAESAPVSDRRHRVIRPGSEPVDPVQPARYPAVVPMARRLRLGNAEGLKIAESVKRSQEAPPFTAQPLNRPLNRSGHRLTAGTTGRRTPVDRRSSWIHRSTGFFRSTAAEFQRFGSVSMSWGIGTRRIWSGRSSRGSSSATTPIGGSGVKRPADAGLPHSVISFLLVRMARMRRHLIQPRQPGPFPGICSLTQALSGVQNRESTHRLGLSQVTQSTTTGLFVGCSS